ncbi:MAG: hypothetical protein DRI28_04715 [Caldiserica bacterium]|nr:MAG: hypothetical protein DRI28_04715 [Caldisericota bacterium]
MVLSTTIAIRRAHYYKNKLIALQIAESGLNKILYKMNYEKYGSGAGHKYPFGDGTLKTTDIDTSAFGPQSSCRVKIDPDGTGADTRIVSEGKYKGRSAKIYVNLRGYAKLDEDLNCETAGISEAFNKHVIYAQKVEGTSSKITGNIFTASTVNLVSSAADQYTVTLSNIPSNISELVRFDTSNYELPDTPASFTLYFYCHNTADGTAYAFGDSAHTDTKFSIDDDGSFHHGIKYSSATDTYEFDTQIDYNIYIEKAGGGVSNGNATFNSSNNHFSKYVKVDGNLTISDDITTETQQQFAFEVGGSCTISSSGITINGDLVIKGANITLDNVTINGAVVCDNGIIFSTNPTTINSTSSSYPAAILINNSSGSCTLDIDASPDITLGDNQKTAILVSAHDGTISINADLLPTYSSSDQFCVVNWSGSNADVNIGTVSGANVNGGIYSYKNILLDSNTQAVTGILVAGETVTFNNSGSLTYNPTPFKDSKKWPIYKGFVGGRRVYLPVPGSWRIEW